MDLLLNALLAQEGGDSMVKIIVGVLFALFWIIAQIAGSLGKKKEEEERRRRMEQIARETEAREREEARRGVAPPPPLPPVMSGPAHGGVSTREEMERRMAEARERRHSGRGVGPPPIQTAEPARRDRVFQDAVSKDMGGGGITADPGRRDRVFQDPVSRDMGGGGITADPGRKERVFQDAVSKDMGGTGGSADPIEELRRRQEEERLRQEAMMRDNARRQQQESARRKALDEKARRAAERQEQLEAEAARSGPSLASERPVYQETFAQATNRPREAVTTVTEGRGKHERAQGADAAAIRKWLTPATLRQQYILTELLSPPVALRRDREW